MAKRLAQLSSEYKIDLSPEIFNDRYYPHLQSIHRWEIFFGGRGSGKSTFIAQKLALQMTTMEGRNLLCLRKQGKDCRMSSFNEIRGALEKFNLVDLWRISESPEPKMVHRVNKNTMIFTGMDDIQDVKSIKFENGNCTDVWYEEVTQEPDKKTLTDLNNGLRDRKLKSRVILSFNPISRSHWLFDFVTKEMKMPGVDSLVLQTTYKDNKFLPSDYAAELERLKYTDPYSYQVDALGDWGQTGQTVFNANKVSARLAELASLEYKKAEFSYEKDDMGRFDPKSTRIFYHADGETKIFKEPEEGVPYVIAFDTAGEGSDYYAAHVVDNITGEQVAVYHSVRDPSDCIIQIFGLGHYYNYALLCPEVNFDSYPLKKLLEWGYHKIYTRESAVDRTDSIYEQKLGFRTTSANRQQMLSELVEWVNENTHLINDADTLNEMLTFTRQSRKQKGIFWAAENGAHDDLVMAAAIVLQAREQQIAYKVKAKVKKGGVYLMEDIEKMFKRGEISSDEKKELMKISADTYGDYGSAKMQRSSARYAR